MYLTAARWDIYATQFSMRKEMIIMKKLLSLFCALTLALTLGGCAGKSDADPLSDMTLDEILTASLKDVPDLPAYEPTPLTADDFEFFTFVPYQDGYEGLQADALIGATPHSVVLVRVPDDKAEDVAETMRKNADPRKWICVSAEKTVVDRSGGTILLVLSGGETANAILTNFKALYGETPSDEELALPIPEDDAWDMDDIPPAEIVVVDENGNPVDAEPAEDEPIPSKAR